ncbi:NitT/TauT family transport system ATP-binding protein [Bosea sp. LC85]|uniref:CmpA/NrtA family ABC transporter substrate-binding protein n=1 Tax=Bosea sp. LC85 TaxID=1502851 RepID=UPI0004E35134|nr:CmpA/NrtA family ABC transporter substrate-binding protein [Bosea sp. LC85]KFC64039.1 NitT/TauT family transport system ATP-binding protein [Bosea sp. LC85]
MTLHLRVGFLPLVDAALLVAAADAGFAEGRGLALELVRDVSWSNLRDRLHVRLLDAAHMLAPAAIASTLGIGGVTAPMAAPILLNLNGNAVTVSTCRFEELARAADGDLADGDLADPMVSARALAKLVGMRKASGLPPLTFAAVFGFSSHTYLLCDWMARGGVRLGQDVRFEVVPPVQTVEALRSGRIDGFCAGAPWNTLAVAAGVGAILHCGVDLQADCPEKALAWRADDVERRGEAVSRLNAALVDASRWAGAETNWPRLAELLATPERLGMPADLIEAILRGEIAQGGGRPVRPVASYIRFDEKALRPEPGHADWLLAAMARAGQLVPELGMSERARAVFRPAAFDLMLS